MRRCIIILIIVFLHIGRLAPSSTPVPPDLDLLFVDHFSYEYEHQEITLVFPSKEHYWNVVWLARIAMGESIGQPLKGMQGVCEVVMNRMYSCAYPNTIYGVIHEPGQFDGINTPAFRYRNIRPEAMRAAINAYYHIDLVLPCGVYHFFNPEVATDDYFVNWCYENGDPIVLWDHTFIELRDKKRYCTDCDAYV